MAEDLGNKVQEGADELVICDHKNCSELGQYIRCYFDLHRNCPRYITHRNYLKTVREMKKERHHPSDHDGTSKI